MEPGGIAGLNQPVATATYHRELLARFLVGLRVRRRESRTSSALQQGIHCQKRLVSKRLAVAAMPYCSHSISSAWMLHAGVVGSYFDALLLPPGHYTGVFRPSRPCVASLRGC
jgi:hypothetical protein